MKQWFLNFWPLEKVFKHNSNTLGIKGIHRNRLIKLTMHTKWRKYSCGMMIRAWVCKNIIFKEMPNLCYVVYTVWKNEKYTLTFKIFRETKIQSNIVLQLHALISRNFCKVMVRVNFCNFNTVLYLTKSSSSSSWGSRSAWGSIFPASLLGTLLRKGNLVQQSNDGLYAELEKKSL